MPPNRRKGKSKSDAVGRVLLREKGDKQKPKKGSAAGSEFHEMPHMFQKAPEITDLMAGNASMNQSVLERNALDEFLDASLSSQARFMDKNAIRVLLRQGAPSSEPSEIDARGPRSDAPAQVPTTPAPNNSTTHTEPTAPLGPERATVLRVPIPRRPVNYVSGLPEVILSPEALATKEEEAFLKWRLQLAEIEERQKRVMTPFEKNLAFWRQLWRVLEKSDIVFQILDARDPLFYRSEDLELYVKEIHSSKKTVLLLNKSDLVPTFVRKAWARYFRHQGVPCIFFSAWDELRRQGVGLCGDQICARPEDIDLVDDIGFSNADTTENKCSSVQDAELDAYRDNPIDRLLYTICAQGEILNGDQLVNLMECLKDIYLQIKASLPTAETRQPEQDPNDALSEPPEEADNEHPSNCNTASFLEVQSVATSDAEEQESHDDDNQDKKKHHITTSSDLAATPVRTFVHKPSADSFVVGLVGYPNVGKSSIINSVLGHKAVSVSRQPGKTKHFQTIPLYNVGLTLCDCPGLVFPQVVATRAHLVINGVAPIDHMRGDFASPIQIICDAISHQLLKRYKLHKEDSLKATREGAEHPLEPRQFLTRLAEARHQMSGGKGGVPELFQMAKMVLRDYTAGKLLHWELPPTTKGLRQSANAIPRIRVNNESKHEMEEQNEQERDRSDDDQEVFRQFLPPKALGGSAQPSERKEETSTKRKQRFMRKKMLKGALPVSVMR